jgi:hypothetical protein
MKMQKNMANLMAVDRAGALHYGTPQHPVGSHETATIHLPDCSNCAVVPASRVNQIPNNQQSMPMPTVQVETDLQTAAFPSGCFLLPTHLLGSPHLTVNCGSEGLPSLN